MARPNVGGFPFCGGHRQNNVAMYYGPEAMLVLRCAGGPRCVIPGCPVARASLWSKAVRDGIQVALQSARVGAESFR